MKNGVIKRNGLFNDLMNFDDDFDIFNDGFLMKPLFRQDYNMPKVNIKENKDNYKVEVAIPGFDKNNVKVEVKDNYLTVSYNKQENKESEPDETYHYKEFCEQNFTRSWSLPENINQSAINAKNENGILTVTLPKQEVKKENTRLIEVK